MEKEQVNVYIPIPYGDGVTERDQAFARELYRLHGIIAKAKGLSPRGRAKCLVSLCYDYIRINLEEKAESLYPKIKEACPEYFTKYVAEDIGGDLEFAIMVDKIVKYFDSIGEER